jgi:hypothetical protein
MRSKVADRNLFKSRSRVMPYVYLEAIEDDDETPADR